MQNNIKTLQKRKHVVAKRYLPIRITVQCISPTFQLLYTVQESILWLSFVALLKRISDDMVYLDSDFEISG